MRYLTAEEIIILHDKLLATTGGVPGLINVGLLESAIENSKATYAGHDLFPDLESKCAAITYSLIQNHPFADGNKRLGAFALLMTLELNGQHLTATDEELEKVIMMVARSDMTRDDLENWLRQTLKNSK
jgi:death-on-curing protein